MMILKADISKTSPARHLFLFIFMCGNSKCTRIQKIKKFSGEVNWVLLALILLNVILDHTTGLSSAVGKGLLGDFGSTRSAPGP